LITLGEASPVPSAVVSNLFGSGQGTNGIFRGNPATNNGPIYTVVLGTGGINTGATKLSFICTLLGYSGGCSYSTAATGTYYPLVPAGATGQSPPWSTSFTNGEGDNHLQVVNFGGGTGNIWEGYQCANNSTWQGTPYAGSLACGFGRIYTIGSNGLYTSSVAGVNGSTSSGIATHSGYSIGVYTATPAEILTAETGGPSSTPTSLPHALGIAVYCLNNTSQWPAMRPSDPGGAPSDQTCTSDTSGNLYPEYGELLRLSPSYSIPSTFTAPCQVLLRTLQDKGGYFIDTGNPGLQIEFLNDATYITNLSAGATPAPDPWPTLFGQMIGGANPDGNGTYNNTGASGMYFYQCMQTEGGTNIIPIANWTVYVLTQP
jgi:hypothetical protein